MISYAPEALRQINDLRDHYGNLERFEAIVALTAALVEAERKIEANPAGGLPALRPYPRLARRGRSLVKAGRYWVSYRTTPRLTIAAVFF